MAAFAGLGSAGSVLYGGSWAVVLPWSAPGGELSFGLDALSAFFLIPLFVLSAAAAVYGAAYIKKETSARQGFHFFLYNLLTASMVLVFAAKNAVLFIAAWEIMAVSSFLLVAWDADKKEEVKKAGLIYFISTHIGAAFIMALFALLWSRSGTASFEAFAPHGGALPFAPVAALALIGFGLKAGFFPLHVWLPEAHPAAPSHVSALMSGVLIKTGIYALLRVISFFPEPEPWFGPLLIVIGAFSGVMGVLFALAQHDLKRLLAYHSVENIGIITMGLGLGYMGLSSGRPVMALFGFAGGLLHVVNHAFFKGLLFLGAGAVLHETGERDLDKLGGLAKQMPVTAGLFLVGSAAIAGLPPLNGFISELMIYLGGFGLLKITGPAAFYAVFAIAALALIGGLALACFAKAFSAVYLGAARSGNTVKAGEPENRLLAPMLLLALLCVLIGFSPVFFIGLAVKAALALAPGAAAGARYFAPAYGGIFAAVSGAWGLLLALALLLWLLRAKLLSKKLITREPTWGCGYAGAAPRAQYSASSFAQPLVNLFGWALWSEKRLKPAAGYFPEEASFSSHTPDAFHNKFYRPGFRAISGLMGKFRGLQHGLLHLYVLYILAALVAALLWSFK